ncbi:MAG: LacI family transcriptional regulator [Rhodobacteraceae bacterium]|nr:LacI family transcriptional regulator [Paracoccaceae bacterium]
MQGGRKTIKDVARTLGVSAATVSRALAGNARISAETRERVERAARDVGYVPNRAAQSLVAGRSSGFVGLILTDPGYGREDSYLGEFISGLGAGLATHGIDLFLAAIPETQSELSVIRNIVGTHRADGLIIGRTSEVDPRVEYLAAAGFPFVSHGRTSLEYPAHSWVDTDGAAAFCEAFEMLYALGHRRFGLVTIEEPMTFRLHRTEGLVEAIARRGDPAVSLQIATAPRYDGVRRHDAICALLSGPDRPTAVLTLFDGLALTVLEEAAHLGLSVPHDLSVIGFDNISSSRLARPGLTTFEAETTRSARESARMLVAQFNAKTRQTVPETLLIRPKLVLRASHGPARETPRRQTTAIEHTGRGAPK